MNAVINSEIIGTAFISGEELYDLGDQQRSELIKGKIKTMSPTGFLHGRIEVKIARILGNFMDKSQLGEVFGGEVGIYIKRNPDTIRGADVLYISHQRLQQVKSKSYLDAAPELVVQVLSPRDRWADVHRSLGRLF